MKKAARGKKMIRVNFTGVDVSGGGRLLPEDTYQFELVELEQEEGQESGEPYLAGVFKVAEGEFEGTKAYDNFSLQPQALWKLRSFLESAGYPTEEAEMDLDPDELIGLVGTGDVIHETYKGKPKHRINSWLVENAEDDGGKKGGKAEDEQEAPVRRPTKKTPKPAEDEVEWRVKDEVTFKDGKKTLQGRITEVDGDKITVRVGRDEYEMSPDDLTAVE